MFRNNLSFVTPVFIHWKWSVHNPVMSRFRWQRHSSHIQSSIHYGECRGEVIFHRDTKNFSLLVDSASSTNLTRLEKTNLNDGKRMFNLTSCDEWTRISGMWAEDIHFRTFHSHLQVIVIQTYVWGFCHPVALMHFCLAKNTKFIATSWRVYQSVNWVTIDLENVLLLVRGQATNSLTATMLAYSWFYP